MAKVREYNSGENSSSYLLESLEDDGKPTFDDSGSNPFCLPGEPPQPKRRSSADRTGWVAAQPRIHTLEVEEVATIRQQAEHVTALVIGQTDGAACGGGGALLFGLGLGVKQFRVAQQCGLIKPHLNNTIFRAGRLLEISLKRCCYGCLDSGAVV
ncbi:unnamed protein product [Ilex paraguariensis]|uniref:Uncharacterized protein n=1 Tax=Ilex paraguariensis TaxID=185542 RepID=A0ABC8SD41_9AQUA